MNPWWLGLAPAQGTVTCGEHHHRLRWAEGALEAIDHDDPEAERSLAALSGQRCPCMDVLDAWARHEGDPRVLVLASRGPSDPIAAEAEWTAQLGAHPPPVASVTAPRPRVAPRQLLRRPARRRARASARGWTSSAPMSARPVARMPLTTEPESELVALLGLGGGLPDRLVATVAATWAQRLAGPGPEVSEARASLRASMHGRLCAALRGWLGRTDLELELDLIEDGRPPSLAASAGQLRAELPFDWLSEVWSRGLVTVFGRFCLAAGTEDGTAWTLSTVSPDLGPPAPVRIELPAEG
jgi:hypothetical protein